MMLKNNSDKKISTFPLIVCIFILEIRDESGLRQRMMEEIEIPSLANYIIYIYVYINKFYFYVYYNVCL